jgi:hypothetical protein
VNRETTLLYRPQDVCIHPATNRAYVVHENTTYIDEIELDSFEPLGSIQWPAPRWTGPAETHFDIECGAETLYVLDGEWSPNLWIIQRASPNVAAKRDEVTGIGGLALSAGEDELFTWYQYGWSAGFAGSSVKRYGRSADAFSLLDTSTLAWTNYRRDPLDSPIFLDERGGRVVNKQFVFNARNLAEVIYRFDDVDVIYGVDFERNRAATRARVLSLDTFNPIRTIPLVGADHLFFDADGNLYLIENSLSALFRIDAGDL